MPRETHNPNCDGGHCTSETGEVRVLPTGGDSNGILCRSCHAHEIRFRRERNRELGEAARFELPAWETLRVYDPGATPFEPGTLADVFAREAREKKDPTP